MKWTIVQLITVCKTISLSLDSAEPSGQEETPVCKICNRRERLWLPSTSFILPSWGSQDRFHSIPSETSRRICLTIGQHWPNWALKIWASFQTPSSIWTNGKFRLIQADRRETRLKVVTKAPYWAEVPSHVTTRRRKVASLWVQTALPEKWVFRLNRQIEVTPRPKKTAKYKSPSIKNVKIDQK